MKRDEDFTFFPMVYFVHTKKIGQGRYRMSLYEDYLRQETSHIFASADDHYDEHTDRWEDEGSVSIYGHSGHVDIHTDHTY